MNIKRTQSIVQGAAQKRAIGRTSVFQNRWGGGGHAATCAVMCAP